MKTHCDIIRDIMPLYSDGICSEKSRALVEEHCGECEECRELLEAMTAPLPEVRTEDRPVNPFRKTRRRLFIISAVTVLLCMLALLFGYLTVNEQNLNARGASWSSVSAEMKMRRFASLMKKGRCAEAFEMVELTDSHHRITDLSAGETAELKKACADRLTAFIGEYPVRSYECSARYRGSRIEGFVSLHIDEKYTFGIPYEYRFDFMEQDGIYYINAMQAAAPDRYYDDADSYEKIRGISRKAALPMYPADKFAENLDRTIISGTEPFYIVSNKDQKYFTKKTFELMHKYKDEQGAVDFEADGYKKERDELGKEISAAKESFNGEFIKLFRQDYRYLSLSSDKPYLTDDGIIEEMGDESYLCFRQRITLNMETLDGESFSVTFTARLAEEADCPFEDILYSENAPADFRERFEKLFE